MHPPEQERIRVLLVSADAAFGSDVANRLEDQHPSISATREPSASSAIERASRFDCVVCDGDLPDHDPLSFLREVGDRHPSVALVFAPADGSEELAAEAIAAGVTGYVPRSGDQVRIPELAERIVESVRESDLERRTAEMERINAVMKNVDAALVHAETRSQLETAVCEVLADSESYRFAWIGEYDENAHSLTPRAHAGEGEGFLDRIPVGEGQTLPDEGPGPRSLETGEVQVSQDVRNDEAFDAYREDVDERGFRSVATVPLAHEDGLYGLLAIYADRSNAFDERERELLESIGGDIGRAIATIEARTDLRRYRQAIDSAGQAIAVTAADGTIQHVNSTFEAQTGYGAERVEGESLSDVLDVSPDAVRESDETPAVERGWEREYLAETADDETYHAEQTITPISDESGELDGFVLVQADVTDRIEREDALRTETEMLKGLFETSPIGIVALSDDGTIRRVNDRATSLLNTPADELIGRSYDEQGWKFVDEDGDPLPPEEDPFHRIREAGEPVFDEEVRLARPEAATIWLSVRGAPLWSEGGDVDGLVFTFDDVTADKERERELRSFEMAVEHAGHCIYMTDPTGEIEYVNGTFVEQTGYERDAAVGATPDILNSGVHDEAFFERMWETILAGEQWEAEVVNRRKDGTLVHVDQSITPVMDDDGEIERFVAINQDITDRKEYQLRLERQNERLEEFASVLSHDLRNPLNVAEGRLELADGEGEHIDAATEALDRMEAIIEDVLTLAREGTAVEETEPVDLESVVEDAWGSVPHDAATLEIEGSFTADADRNRLRRILENLFRNSLEHVGEDVALTVGPHDDGFFVEDTGPGIPQEIRDQVFESGYTRSESGTGLGLAIVRQLADAHGWSVALTEGDDGGARFEFGGVRRSDDTGD